MFQVFDDDVSCSSSLYNTICVLPHEVRKSDEGVSMCFWPLANVSDAWYTKKSVIIAPTTEKEFQQDGGASKLGDTRGVQWPLSGGEDTDRSVSMGI